MAFALKILNLAAKLLRQRPQFRERDTAAGDGKGEGWDELGLRLFNNVHIEILLYRDFSRSALRFFTVRPFGRIIITFMLLAPVGPTWRMRNAR